NIRREIAVADIERNDAVLEIDDAVVAEQPPALIRGAVARNRHVVKCKWFGAAAIILVNPATQPAGVAINRDVGQRGGRSIDHDAVADRERAARRNGSPFGPSGVAVEGRAGNGGYSRRQYCAAVAVSC